MVVSRASCALSLGTLLAYWSDTHGSGTDRMYPLGRVPTITTGTNTRKMMGMSTVNLIWTGGNGNGRGQDVWPQRQGNNKENNDMRKTMEDNEQWGK